MSGRIFLIGGGEIINGETRDIDDRVLANHHPSRDISFIGVASGDSEGYFDCFRAYYINLLSERHLPAPTFHFITSKTPKDVFSKNILASDVIYLGGGATSLLLGYLKSVSAKETFLKALKNDATIAGISAGAYALSQKSIHVNDDGTVEQNPGLALAPVICEAHATTDRSTIARRYLSESEQEIFLPLSEGEAFETLAPEL